MKTGKLSAVVSLFVVMAMMLCAFGQTCVFADSEIKSSKDTMIMRMANDPGTVDLLTVSSYESTGLYSMVGNSLLSSIRDEESGSYAWVVNDKYSLAESYDIAEDQLSVVFHLRHGVKFHNGKEFTAEDAVYSISRYNNAKYSFIDFDNLSALSDYELYVPFTKIDASAVSPHPLSVSGCPSC